MKWNFTCSHVCTCVPGSVLEKPVHRRNAVFILCKPFVFLFALIPWFQTREGLYQIFNFSFWFMSDTMAVCWPQQVLSSSFRPATTIWLTFFQIRRLRMRRRKADERVDNDYMNEPLGVCWVAGHARAMWDSNPEDVKSGGVGRNYTVSTTAPIITLDILLGCFASCLVHEKVNDFLLVNGNFSTAGFSRVW